MEWRFTIIEPDDNELIVDEPIGWDALSKVIRRDDDMHGVMFEFSENTLEFTHIACKMLSDYEKEFGVDADVKLKIEWSCDGVNWLEFFNGNFDFSRFEEKKGIGCSVKIGIDKSTNALLLKNREDVAVDLTSNKAYNGESILTDYPGLDIEMEIPAKAIKVMSRADGGTTRDISEDSEWDRFNPLADIRKYQIYPGFGKTTYSDIPDTFFFNETTLLAGGYANLPSDLNPVIDFQEFSQLKCSVTDVTLNYRFKGSTTKLTSVHDMLYSFHIMKLPAGADPLDSSSYEEIKEVEMLLLAGSIVTMFDIADTQTITLEKGDKLFVYFFLMGFYDENNPFTITFDNETFFDISLTSICEDSTAKVALINEAASRIIEHITDNQLKFKSDYYGRTDSLPFASDADGCGSLRTITNGLYIRKATMQDGSNPKMQVSFKDLIESLIAVDAVGLDIEGNNVIVEPIKHFYSDEVIFEADNVNEIVRTKRTDRIFNQANIGYDKWETEQYNGLDAIHTKRNYRLQIKNTRSKFEKYSKAIVDGYAIEVTRRKAGLTEDWRYDNNMFWICCKRESGSFVAEKNNISSPQYLFSPATILNYRLSPIRNLMKWFHWIMQSVANYSSATNLLFSGGDGNFVAEGLLNNGCIYEVSVLKENENLDESKFDEPEFAQPWIKPEKVTFKYPVSIQEFLEISSNKYGKIKYRANEFDAWEYGWISEIKYLPNDGIAEFNLTPSIN